MNETSFSIDSSEGPYNTGKKYENGNLGHRPGVKGGYFPVPPVDSAQDMRSEYLKALKDIGVKVEAPSRGCSVSARTWNVLWNIDRPSR